MRVEKSMVGMEAPRAEAAAARRPPPDPEVVAKPTRRQFTAEYRLRIIEEAQRCTRPGEVGRLLRREGLKPEEPLARVPLSTFSM